MSANGQGNSNFVFKTEGGRPKWR